MSYEALVWAWALALVLLCGAVVIVMGALTARLVGVAAHQAAHMSDTGAGPPPPQRTRKRT